MSGLRGAGDDRAKPIEEEEEENDDTDTGEDKITDGSGPLLALLLALAFGFVLAAIFGGPGDLLVSVRMAWWASFWRLPHHGGVAFHWSVVWILSLPNALGSRFAGTQTAIGEKSTLIAQDARLPVLR